ncbi:hypothetical protein [Rhizobium sp. BK456]|uniref:hypothetical protein n=1 Tax=Rhizobium sp. BK456 TaxID=2587007 RepID=UPI00161B6453|nr:hypothetical protein [Rhizobium sp. BK456]MBB3521064.1 hypothetical protein [Rhizobium sp. BK456]
MSHTVIIDEDYRGQQLENRLNAVIRHCKIGKVTRKYVAPTGLIPGGVILPALDDYFTWNPAQAGGYVQTTSSGDVPLVPSHGVLL